MRLTFGLFPVGSMVSGSVVVVRTNTGLLATVFANGLVPASVHTVHIHRGNCANPYGGMHITVLGLMAGGPADNGVLTAPIAPVYLSPGHYVIVYATASAQRIIACANL
jgi:hypothetical protein